MKLRVLNYGRQNGYLQTDLEKIVRPVCLSYIVEEILFGFGTINYKAKIIIKTVRLHCKHSSRHNRLIAYVCFALGL